MIPALFLACAFVAATFALQSAVQVGRSQMLREVASRGALTRHFTFVTAGWCGLCAVCVLFAVVL